MPLDADPVRLAQVFSNLLNNAARYCGPRSHIGLSADREGAEVVVRVRDDGVGIPADSLPHVFEMFVQVDRSLERASGGLGIGLTLVQRIVELHGGTVEARSDGPGRGSEFTVRLPRAGPNAAARGGQPAVGEGAPSRRARRVLVVDDNRDSADSMTELLRILGCEVSTAYDGEQALQLIAASRPDAVLLDLGMPGLSGYEVARQVRERGGGEPILLIALTGWGQEEDRRRTREAGFDHHLVKPVELTALRAMLG
jgi:CheY-like chemotaxis protein